MLRMRTDKQIIAELKESDPDCGFTRHALRQLALSGVIPYVKIGRKRLFAMENIEKFLRGELAEPSETKCGVIRKLH